MITTISTTSNTNNGDDAAAVVTAAEHAEYLQQQIELAADRGNHRCNNNFDK
jgi:hypothetical protein